MIYLLVLFLPPVAVLLCGRPIQALINLVLCLFFWIPGIIHAWMVVSDKRQDKRIKKQTKTLIKAQQNQSE
ncbi:YqaE/Pmp3 family membrane protein [Bacillus sp. UNC322MFChir4.1]|uniref:YqaE/Pmp3 family membrane protein n=1 Tax=Bacillus sp. UNC322MFChir4.1 TaxID=1449045 RepID=UPI00068E0056|nr:YqaE/Pmp3 family membrane protein [Bacillus sp. UNC322MFChir4.1]